MKKPNLGFEWSYRDLLFTMMIAYMAMAVMVLLIASKKVVQETTNPGNILVELFWDIARDADVDLWVAYAGERPVGYSNKSGVTFNLLRDDLGKSHDPESRNHELTVGRGLKEGPYTVNVHLYRSRDLDPIAVTVKVTTHKPNSSPTEIAHNKIILERENQEETLVRFSLNKNGDLIPGSINTLPKKIRSSSYSAN